MRKPRTHDNGVHCAWKGCMRTTTQPMADGWAYLCIYPPPFKDGHYCREHADAVDAAVAATHNVKPASEVFAAAAKAARSATAQRRRSTTARGSMTARRRRPHQEAI
jgi:hypothetical protein